MIYVFDTSSFRELRSVSRNTFVSFWDDFAQAISEGQVVSVREVAGELQKWNEPKMAELFTWLKAQGTEFAAPTPQETLFVAEIFKVPHFRQLVGRQQLLNGRPVADPFVIAAAKEAGGCVVTEEKHPPNGAKIPNVCEHFGIRCITIEGFFEEFGQTY